MKNSLKKIMALVAVATTLTGGVTALADEGTSSLATTSQVETTSTNVDINYSTHVQKEGWQDYVSNGASAGTTGKSLRLEGIKINVKGDDNLGIEYSTHVQKIGWQDYVSDDQLSGTEGQALRLEAIKIRLTGEDKDKYDIYYRVHAQSYGWLDWAKNDEISGTVGCAKRLEAIQIQIVPKGETAPGATDKHVIYANPTVSYKTHVQKKGWQNTVTNGATSGTIGKSLRLEGIKINVSSPQYSGGISYSTHVQKKGWQNPVTDGALSGTEGQALRLEAIKMNLTGELAEHFDIYYRVQCQKIGWMGWSKNGNAAGTTGYGYRLEAIQIKVVPKDEKAPGSTSNSYVDKKVNGDIFFYSDGLTRQMRKKFSTLDRLYYGAKSSYFDSILSKVASGEMTKAKALSLVQNYTWNEPLANLGQGLTDEWGNILVGLQAQNAEIFQKTYKSASQALSSEDLYWHTGNYCNVVAYENSNGTVKVTNLKFDYIWGEPY